MSYEVTATRKRPTGFQELAGQEFVVSTLKNSIKNSRIAHAYLFSGPRGVGKTSAARILAKALNCQKGPTDEPCGACAICQEITAGNSLDVIEIDGASNTSVNDVREIKDEVLFAPNNGKYKVYIIDEVHMLSNSAFNALLKTIEEPPPYIVFIFATTEIHKVPATIRSRCQQYNFRLIPVEIIKQHLSSAAQEMQIEAEDEALFWIAKEAAGSLRDGYTLFDQIVSLADGSINMDIIKKKLGLVGIDTTNTLVEYIFFGDRSKVLHLADEILSKGVSVEQFIIDLAEYFRTLLLLKESITSESLLRFKADRFSKQIIEGFSITQLETSLDLILNLYRGIRYSINQRFELELLISRLTGITSYLSPQEILCEIEALRSELQATSISGNDQHQGTAKPALLSKEQIEAISQSLKKKPALQTALEKAVSWKQKGTELHIIFDTSYPASVVKQDYRQVQSAAAEVLKTPVEISITVTQAEKAETCENEHVELVKQVFRGQIMEEKK